MKIAHLVFATLLLSACSADPLISEPALEADPIESTEDIRTTDSKGPWDGTLYLSTSEDGLKFSGKELVLERAGVPSLLKLQSGELVLVYQYFSDTDPEFFDIIAYSISSDNGLTWSPTAPIAIEGLPEGMDEKKKPMDPTLVQLEDGRLRLYFTFHAKGNKTAALYSATTPDADITSAFTTRTTPALITTQNLLDPSVTFFDGLWHHYSWQEGSDNNYHSTSKDGLSFTLQDDIVLPMDFLGQVIPFEDGLRYYGTGNGVTSAFSNDGFTWEIDEENIAPGADPGVQKLEDGSYVMIYTSLNFNEAP